MSTLYLHIGTKKTGSTSIQHVLRRNAQALGAQGFLVPSLFGQFEGSQLARLYLTGESPQRQAAMRRLRRSCQEFGSGGDVKVILSAESLVDLRAPSVAELAEGLQEIFDTIKIFLYIRRQDLMAVSHYSTALRGGGVSTEFYSPRLGPGMRALKFGTLVTDWSASFSADSLTVRIYDQLVRDGVDIVLDFMQVCGIKADQLDLTTGTSQNARLSAEAMAYLCLYNSAERQSGVRLPQARRLVLREVEQLPHVQPPLRPSRATMLNFYQQFAEENETVRSRFFPDMDHLFDNDFSMYPETAPLLADVVSGSEVMQFMVRILRYLASTDEPITPTSAKSGT